MLLDENIYWEIPYCFVQETFLIKHLLKAYTLCISTPVSIMLILPGQTLISLNKKFIVSKHKLFV